MLDRICFVGGPALPRHTSGAPRPRGRPRCSFPDWDDDLAHAWSTTSSSATKRRDQEALPRHAVRGRRRLGLASRAPLTFFDEPYLGLDAVARQLFYDRLLADYAEHPRTVVLSTHLIDEVSDLLDHVVVLDHGRVVVDEDAETLRGSLVVVSGPSGAVDDFAAGHEVVHRENLGPAAPRG